MSLPTRAFALAVIGLYAAAAALPCGAAVLRPGASDAHADRSTGAAHGIHAGDPSAPAHGGHAGHPTGSAPGGHAHRGGPAQPPEGTASAALTAPCPCGCSESADAPAGSTGRIGYALARDASAPAFFALRDPLPAPALRLPGAPALGSDPIPI